MDVARDQRGQSFGCKVVKHRDGLVVIKLNHQENDLVARWNERSAISFAPDCLKPGDVLLMVNDIGIDSPEGAQGMIWELATSAELLLLVRRET